jgi:DNA-binding CsgD family transcriptional regulator
MPISLRPVERCVRRLSASGLDEVDIAWRIRRTPRYVRQVLTLSDREDRAPVDSRDDRGLRPLERRVLSWRELGASHADLAARFRRSERSVRQVERLAHYKLGLLA